SHSMFQRPRNIAHGEFELNVLRPGDEDDLFLRGWMEQLDAYDERVGHAVRTAQELAAELRRERVRGGSVGRHRPAAGMTRACVTR
ncbi:MAG: hypothetical protein JWM25_1464, partial [Thermoleophilia bacterium]|nr:hypothetical protein [Thermoleophilia bacterium]